MKTPQGN